MADLTPELLAIAERLRYLPREDFKARLKAELKEKAMTATVAAIPKLMPYLVVRGAARLVDFMTQAFGAQEMERFAKRSISWAPNACVMKSTNRAAPRTTRYGMSLGIAATVAVM